MASDGDARRAETRMRVEKFVGQRVRARRDELGMTQEEFGRRVGPLVGKTWSRQTVSVAEQGGRAWTAAELLVAAHVLETHPARLLTPPVGVTEVELPGGEVLGTVGMADIGTSDLEEEIVETLARLSQRLQSAQQANEETLAIAQQLADEWTTERLAASGVVSRSRVNREGEVSDYDPGSREWVKRESAE